MLHALACLTCCTAVASQDVSRHVIDRLPLAAPDASAFVGLIGTFDGVRALVDEGDALSFLELEVDENGVLRGAPGGLGAVLGDATGGVALDPDGDGREAWWFIDGASAVEIVADWTGRPVEGLRVDLPAADARTTRGGRIVLPSGLVGTLAAPFGAPTEFVALWSGPARALAAIDGGPRAALVAIAPDGSAWLATPHATRAIELAEPATEVLARVDANGALVVLYRGGASGTLRRATLDRVVDGALAGVDRPLAVEEDTIRLDDEHVRLVDVDADGDLDLVANEGGHVVVRPGWGAGGFLAPRAFLTGEAAAVRTIAGATLALLTDRVARLDGAAPRSQPAPPGARIDAVADVDHDGDMDLVCGEQVATNDNAGGFTFAPADPSSLDHHLFDASTELADVVVTVHADAVEIEERSGGDATYVHRVALASMSDVRVLAGDAERDTFAVQSASGVVRSLRRDGEGWKLGPPRVAPPGAILVDVDEDGDDDLVVVAGAELHTVHGPRYSVPEDGAFLQVASGVAGPDGATPLLGAHGPARLSDAPGRVHLSTTAPDQVLFVAVSPDARVLDALLGGLTTLLDRHQLTWIEGRTDADGAWSFPLDYDPDLVGRTLFGQAHVVDARDGGCIRVSNRLAITYGR